MISYQDTLPLPKISRTLPTLRQVREQCGMSHVELANIADVRPLTAYCMKSGRAVAIEDAERTWRPQGIATTIRADPFWKLTSDMVVAIPCGRHVPPSSPLIKGLFNGPA